MRRNLLLLSWAAIIALVAISAWATSKLGIVPAIEWLVAAPADGIHPWFVATLVDAYFGFLWFWAWIAYKETSNVVRGTWLVLVLGFGNLAMAAYMLLQLRKLPAGAGPERLLLRQA